MSKGIKCLYSFWHRTRGWKPAQIMHNMLSVNRAAKTRLPLSHAGLSVATSGQDEFFLHPLQWLVVSEVPYRDAPSSPKQSSPSRWCPRQCLNWITAVPGSLSPRPDCSDGTRGFTRFRTKRHTQWKLKFSINECTW